MKIRSTLKGAAAPLALSIALISQPAFAQDAAVSDEDLIEDSTETEVADEEGAIIVTGSRIRRNETTSASPLQIIDPVIARRAGRNDTAEIIQNSPIANGSSQITSAISSNGISNGGPGAQTISLRGLGAARTLVLLNSRRAGPAGTRGAVSSFDLNVLPSSIIQSVEVLKDGASSVYGSDAIAGVVNILTKKGTDGLELTAFGSLPFEGAGENYTVSAAWGKEFDRGHFMVAGEYYRQNELERGDRDYLGCEEDFIFSPDGKTRRDLIDPRTGEYFCNGVAWGHVWTYFSNNLPNQPKDIVSLLQYSYGDDNLGTYLPGIGPATGFGDIITPPGWYAVSYETTNAYRLTNSYHPFEQKASVIPDIERYTLYADASFEIADGIEAYAEGIFNRRTSYTDSLSQFYNFGYTDLYAADDADDPFQGWTSFAGAGAFISPTGILDQYDNDISVDYYRGVAGLRGDVTNKISFDVHGQYSLSKGEYRLQQILQDVITQQTDRAYGYGCAGQFTPISNRECLQVNWVDPRVMAGDLTQAEIDYFTEWETGTTDYEQMFVEASIAGEAFDLPAGPLGFALGAVIRRDDIDDTPGHITRALTPGGDPTNEDDYIDNAFANGFSSGHTFGHSTTKEAFIELEVPVLADMPLVQNLTLSGAARVTNVKAVRGLDGFSSASNGNWTYKLMANWQVNDTLRFRGTYGTSYRAPALFEQFLADQVTGARQNNIDPCVRWGEALIDGTITQRIADNCAADGIDIDHRGVGIQADVYTSGGIGTLDPETSRAWTASVILTPRFASLPNTDIDLTVDYFDIKVNGEIAQLGASSILYNCYNAVDFPNNEFCDLFERGQDGNEQNVKNVFRKFINVDEQTNKGFDFTLRVRQDMGNMGNLTLLGQGTLQTEDTVSRLGVFENYNGDVGDPKFTGDVSLTWDIEDTSVYWGMTIIGAASSEGDYIEDFGSLCNPLPEFVDVYGGDYCVVPATPATWYHNVSVTQQFMDNKFELTAGISNLFNTRPPQISGLVTAFGPSAYVSQYDLFGRRAFVGLKANF